MRMHCEIDRIVATSYRALLESDEEDAEERLKKKINMTNKPRTHHEAGQKGAGLQDKEQW